MTSDVGTSRIHRSSLNMLASAAGYVVPMAVNLVTTPLLLSWLGTSAYGLNSLVGVVIGYLAFMDMGLDVPIIKLLAEDRARGDVEGERRLLGGTLQIYAAIGCLGMLALALSAGLLVQYVFTVPPELTRSARIVFALAGLGFLGSVLGSWGRAVAMGLQRFELSYGVSVVTGVGGTLIGLGVVGAGYGVVGYVLVRVIMSVAQGPACWLLARHLMPEFRFEWGVDRQLFRRVRAYVGYGTLNRVISSGVSRIDQTLIGAWVSVAAAGVYAVPFLIVTSVGYMLAYMLGFMFPLASELATTGQIERLRDIFTRATRFIAASGSMIFVPVLVFGDRFLALWVPGIAADASPVLRLLAIGAFINVLCSSLTNNVVIGIGRMREFTIYATVRACVLAVLAVVLIRAGGMVGAAWAVLLTGSVDVVFLSVAVHSYLGLSARSLLGRAYIAPLALAAATGVAGWLARPLVTTWPTFVTAGIVFEGVYTALAFKFGIFGTTERNVILNSWRAIRAASKPVERAV